MSSETVSVEDSVTGISGNSIMERQHFPAVLKISKLESDAKIIHKHNSLKPNVAKPH